MDKLEIKQGSFIQQTQTKDGLRMSDKMDVLKWQLKKKFTGKYNTTHILLYFSY
jgi:hypothetical protein